MSRSQQKADRFGREPHGRTSRTQHATTGSAPRALLAALTIVIVALVVAVYEPVLSAGALFIDDHQYLVENPLVPKPSWASAERFFREVLEPSTVGGYYQPLSMISLMVDYAVGGRGDDLRVFHATSLVLHVANTVLVILLLYLLFGRPWAAATVGLLFGVHPLHIESIAWIAERKTVLATTFALLSLNLYVRYASTRSRRLYGTSVATYMLALLSKPTTTPLPALMLLLDFWPLRRISRRAVLEKLPFFVIGGASAVITCISQHRTAGTGLPGGLPATRIPLILCHNIIFYLCKIIWPAHLSPFYAFPEPLSMRQPMVLVGVIGTCLLLAALLASLRWTRAVLTGWLFFFLAILPTMGIIGFTVVIAADRFAYLPMVGLMVPLAWFVGRWWSNVPGERHPVRARAVVLGAVAILVAGEAVATRAYIARWRDTESLYQYALKAAPNAPWLHANLAAALNQRGAFDEGIQHCMAALRVLPNDPEAHNNLGGALQEKGRIDDAVVEYRKALQSRPRYALGHHNLATALHLLGRTDEAITEWNEALRLRPQYADAHNNLGSALLEKGRLNEATEHYRAAIAIQPNHLEARYNLAAALSRQGKTDEAIQGYTELLRRWPRHAPTHYALARLLASQGRLNEAIAEYREVLRIEPGNAVIRGELNALLMKGGGTSRPAGSEGRP